MHVVTGATGFIGRKLVERLVSDGERVRALAMLGEQADFPGGVEVVRADVTVPATLEPSFAGARRVTHLAAVVGDWGPRELFWRVNVGGTRNVLEAAARAGVERLVMVSSIVVYGDHLLDTPVCDEERTPMGTPVGPYSETKQASELLAREYHRSGRLPVTVVRPGNVYGEESGLWVHELVSLLRRGRVPLVAGGAGDASMAYVDNVVDVIVRASLCREAAGRVYNANDGSGVTWRRYLFDLAAAAGAAPPRVPLPGAAARALASGFEGVARLRRTGRRPLFTREAARLLRSRAEVPVSRARMDLGYGPPVSYDEAMRRLAAHLAGRR